MAELSYGFPDGTLPSGTSVDQRYIDGLRLYGVDLWYDVTEGDDVDLHVTQAGDYLEVSGLEAFRQALIRRMVTDPGEWARLPNYGAGLRRMVKERATPDRIAEMQERCRSQAMQDDRTESVQDVVVKFIEDGIKLLLVVFPKAGPRRPSPLRITIVTDGTAVSVE